MKQKNIVVERRTHNEDPIRALKERFLNDPILQGFDRLYEKIYLVAGPRLYQYDRDFNLIKVNFGKETENIITHIEKEREEYIKMVYSCEMHKK